jgi:hypothetical protein
MAAKLLDPIPPGEILYEDFMKPLGVSMNALAREIAVPLSSTPTRRHSAARAAGCTLRCTRDGVTGKPCP